MNSGHFVSVVRMTLFGAILGLTGCLTTSSYTPVQHYTIAPDVNVGSVGTPPTAYRLAVRSLDYALPYKQPIVYRTTPYTLEYYEDDEWAELPRDMITRALVDALTATELFADAGNAHDLLSPHLVLTGELRRFEELRASRSREALCEVRMELRTINGTAAIWADTISVVVPLESNTVDGLAKAMSEAVSSLIEEATAQIVQATRELAKE